MFLDPLEELNTMLTIIGCGDTNRKDDAVGIIVAQRLRSYLHNHPNLNVRVFDASTGGMDIMFQARGSDELIIVDASHSGSSPGDIFEVPGDELGNTPHLGYSTNNFSWEHALFAGKQLFKNDFPEDVTIYLIEAADLSLGMEMTHHVEKSATRVVEIIANRIRQHLQ